MGRGDDPESGQGRNTRRSPIFSEVPAGPARDVAGRDASARSRLRDHRLFRQDEAMRVRVDHGADAVYLNLTDRPIKDSEEVADGIVVDYDANGRIVGIEILDASKRTEDPSVLKQFSFDLPNMS